MWCRKGSWLSFIALLEKKIEIVNFWFRLEGRFLRKSSLNNRNKTLYTDSKIMNKTHSLKPTILGAKQDNFAVLGFN